MCKSLIRRSRGAPAAAFALALALTPTLAATTADLEGRVVGKDAKPLPGVTVIVRNDGLAIAEQGAVTDATGSYRLLRLPPGPGYRVRASLPGYAPVEFSDVELTSNRVTTLDVVLRPASEMQETIRVRGKTDLVDTDTVVTSTTFSSDFIAGLPILGRDYQDILTLAPGVTDVDKTGNPNIHGARDTSVITLVDGVSTTDPLTGLFGQQLNIESIQEIEVITSGATAEYSRAQGGFANIITKSGGNEFQGTFKLFLRTHRLDGDGAGIDPPETSGGFGGAQSFRALSFTDLKPFLSVSGAFLKDRLWYYLSSEFIQEEVPLNAVRQAFVTLKTGYREFGKATWQMSPAHKLAFSVILDDTQNENQGVDSFTDFSSGYTFQRGGPTYTLKETAVFRPTVLLDTSIAWFDNTFHFTPTTDPDTNGNGILYVDDRPELGGNRDGIFQANERDSGEDWDVDRAYDLWEDLNRNGILEIGEDLDLDRRLTPSGGCEGPGHEDLNCNGRLDREVDADLDGFLDDDEDTGIPCGIIGLCPEGVVPGTRENGRFDAEDGNANGALDTTADSGHTPFPFWVDRNGDGHIQIGEFQSPMLPDEEFTTDSFGRTSGPYPVQRDDHRKRFTFRQELSLFVADFLGTHDLKIGGAYEHEGYDGQILRNSTITLPAPRSRSGFLSSQQTDRERRAFVFLGYPANVNNTAVGDNFGIYFQDTYKPLPNLTFGLGLRFDAEGIESTGYTPFDPVAERRVFDDLMGLSGVDTEQFDAISRLGICGDPLHPCPGGSPAEHRWLQIVSQLRTIAPRRLTRHQSVVDVSSPLLRTVLGRDVTLADLLDSGVNPRQPGTVRLENRNLAPRLSVSWDPWADGKTKGFASWGRFYDKLFLGSAVLEQGPDFLSRYYIFDSDGVNSRGLPDHRIGPLISQSPPSPTQIDRDLSTPYSDELTVGFERELAPELSVRLTYVRRDYRDQLQDIDINHRILVDPVTGRPADQYGALECGRGGDVGFKNENCAAVPDGLPDLSIHNFFVNRLFQLGNYNSQTYRGWEVELVRRLSRKWQMESSYTFSRAQGDAESYLSPLGDDPSLTEYEPGFLSYDQRHVVKLNAMAYLPRDWRIGGTAQWSSGLPYSVVFDAFGLDNAGYAQSRVLYGRIEKAGQGLVREDRNIHRNHATYVFNARTQKNFVIGKTSASAFFEVYNLLNSDALRVYEVEWFVPPSPNPVAVQRVNAVRDFGRRFQVGIQLDF